MKMTLPARELLRQMRRSIQRDVIRPVQMARLGWVMAAYVMAVEQSVVDSGAYRAAWSYLLNGLPAPLSAIREAPLDEIVGIGNAMVYAHFVELGWPGVTGEEHWINRDHGQVVRKTKHGYWVIRTDPITGESIQSPGGNLRRVLDASDGILQQQLYLHARVA